MAAQHLRLGDGRAVAGNAGLAVWLVLLSVGTAAGQTVATNLRAYYNFETTTNLGLDTQGANALTTSGNAVASTNRVIGDYSLSLDGVGDYLSTTSPTTALTPTGAITVAAWVRITGGTDAQEPVGFFTRRTGTTSPYRIQVSSTATGVDPSARIGTTAERNVTADLNYGTAGPWHHMVMTYDGSQLRLFSDGIFQTQTAATGNLNYGTGTAFQSFAIGAQRSDTGVFSTVFGLIDDVGVWGRALSAREIAAVSGLGNFSSVPLNSGQIDSVLALNAVGQSAVAGGQTWAYATGLTGTTGFQGGSVAGNDAFIVLDGVNGTGVVIVPEPSTVALLAVALTCLAATSRSRNRS